MFEVLLYFERGARVFSGGIGGTVEYKAPLTKFNPGQGNYSRRN